METETELKGFQLYTLLTAVALVAFLISLDAFIINVAIPTIAGELGVREDVGTWLITVFSIASTACIPLSGALSIRFGSYPLFMFGLILFTLASWLSGLSLTFQQLLIGRFFQGCAAGLLTPVSLSLIVNNFPLQKRSIAVGFWSFFVMVGPAMGPMIGGWLSDYRWHWLFFLNVPFSFFSLAIVWILLSEKKEIKQPYPLDILGFILLFTCVGSYQSALNRWNIYDWFASPIIVSLFILASISFVFFIVWEKFHPTPFIDLALFKKRNFILPSLTTGISMALLFSSFVIDSLWVQDVLGYTPAWAGLVLSPVGFFPLIFYPLMGRFVFLLDLRIWVIFSFLLYAMTFWWLSRINLYTPFWLLTIPRLIQGIGFAFFTIPNSLLAMRGTPPERVASVVSIFSFVRLFFVGFGVALAITLWTFRQAFYQTRLISRLFLSDTLLADLSTPFDELSHSSSKSVALVYQAVQDQASTLALADIYYLYSWLFLALCALVLFYKPLKP
jgi:DHA2 family multidrug resistance protein